MPRFAVRLLMLGLLATTLAAVPVVISARAAPDATVVKKKHRKTTPASETQTSKTPSQYPPNMADDPNRKISY